MIANLPPSKPTSPTNSNYSIRRIRIPRQQIPCKQFRSRKEKITLRTSVPFYSRTKHSAFKTHSKKTEMFLHGHISICPNPSVGRLSSTQCPSIIKTYPKKVRRFHPDRHKIIQNDVEKLLAVRFIREVDYPEWLANVVVVPKKEGKWRVCVDYTNLNDTYPKDSFPLPRIDQIVDSTIGHAMLSFLDVFSGYHQILMALMDEEKIAFITPHRLYCYKVMSFELKNTGATYQRLMTKIFKPLISRMVEVYIDDIVVKSKT